MNNLRKIVGVEDVFCPRCKHFIRSELVYGATGKSHCFHESNVLITKHINNEKAWKERHFSQTAPQKNGNNRCSDYSYTMFWFIKLIRTPLKSVAILFIIAWTVYKIMVFFL